MMFFSKIALSKTTSFDIKQSKFFPRQNNPSNHPMCNQAQNAFPIQIFFPNKKKEILYSGNTFFSIQQRVIKAFIDSSTPSKFTFFTTLLRISAIFFEWRSKKVCLSREGSVLTMKKKFARGRDKQKREFSPPFRQKVDVTNHWFVYVGCSLLLMPST